MEKNQYRVSINNGQGVYDVWSYSAQAAANHGANIHEVTAGPDPDPIVKIEVDKLPFAPSL